jgi:hypothetical protein
VLEERSLRDDVTTDGLQEATTGVVGVTDFDSNTVRRMLAFFYTGEYEDGQVDGTGAGAALIGAAAYDTVWLKANSRSSLIGRQHHFANPKCHMLRQEESVALQRKGDRAQAYDASRRAATTLPDPTSPSTAAAAKTSVSDSRRVDDDAENDHTDEKGAIPSGSSSSGSSSSTNAGATSANTEGNAPAPSDDTDAESAPVVANVHVYALAEYYDVPPLKAHALDKLLARIAHMGGWPADGLVRALHLAPHLVRDGDLLYDLLCTAAVEHAAVLVAHPHFR